MDLKKKGFQLPEKIRFDEETLTDTYGKLIAEPLERGYGTTLGNSLRRVLISSLEGAAVSAVRIKGAVHEFSSVEGVKEDMMNIILNMKKLRFVMHGDGVKMASINVKGPGVVTGADIKPEGDIDILTLEQPIATLDKGATFEAEVYLKKGKGYVPADQNKDENLPVDAMAVDSVYSPVKKVNFWVEKARVGRSTDYDRLVLEFWTDGSINPEKAISQSASILIEHLNFFIFEKDDDDEKEQKMSMSSSIAGGYEDEALLNENLTKSVEELELSVRAQNCLKNASIKTIAELVMKTEHDMLKTKNFGRKSLNEIKEILNSMGLRFGMKVDPETMQVKLGGGNAA
ncbi:MAG: DNA-directed RNA polymerase subunit alpha [Nitrospiraceae bacterium]|nr:DNA-directed RNA polymerase subunit alpha [Nitrospiraceae bacterium]